MGGGYKMADYDLTGINLSVEIGGQAQATKDFDKLIKQLEKMGVNVKVDMDTTQVEKQAEKIKHKITQVMDSANINPELNQQAFGDLHERIRKIRNEVDELAKVDIMADKNNNIQKAILTYQDGMGKAITETMAWKEVIDEATSTMTKTFETQGFKYSDNIAKEQSAVLKENIEREKTLISLNEQRYNLNKQVAALMKDSSFRGTDEYKDMALINSQIKAIKQSEGAIDKEQIVSVQKMISDLKIKLDIESRYLSQKDKEEDIQSKINKQLREISTLKESKFISSEDVSRLDDVEGKLKKLKTNSTDATHELNKMANEVKDVGLNTQAIEKLTKENDKFEKSTFNARLQQESLNESVRKLKETKVAYDVEGIDDFVRKLEEIDVESEDAKKQLQELQKEFVKLNNSATEMSSKSGLISNSKTQIGKLDGITISNDKFNEADYTRIKTAYESLIREIESGNITLAQAKIKYDQLSPELKEFENAAKKASDTTNSLSDRIKRYFQFNVVSDALQLMKQGIREVITTVGELDSSLVELQKVSDLAGDSLDDVTNRAFAMGNTLARTGKDVIDAVTTAKRAGYDMEDSFKLGEQALVMTNVAENIKSVEDASGSLVSVLRGYGMEVDNVTHLVDAFNEVSNTQAVNFDDLVEGATRISGVMSQQGNSFEEMLGLVTGGTEILRDVEKVSSGIQTITMRLAGMSEEGDKLDSQVVSKMTDDFERLAGISLVDTTGQIRDTYDILSDMAEVMPTLDKNTRQYLLELSSGKRQANVLEAILTNWENVEKSVDSATNSYGSAEKEMEKYLNSIEGKTNQLKSNLQELSIDFISSSTVKGVLDLINGVLRLVDACGGLNTVIIALVASYALLNQQKVVGGVLSIIQAIKNLTTVTTTATVATKGLALATSVLKGGLIVGGIMAIGAGLKYVSETAKRAEEKVATLGEELAKLNTNKVNVDVLSKQYEELKKLKTMQGLNNDEQREFTDIQNQLKELLPSVNGYYSEQGDFVISVSESMDTLIAKQKESIEATKQAYAEASKVTFANNVGDYGREIESYKKAKAELEKYQAYKSNRASGGAMDLDIEKQLDFYNDGVDGAIRHFENIMKDWATTSNESLGKVKQDLLNVMYVTDEWKDSTEEQKQAIQEFITSSKDVEVLQTYFANAGASVTQLGSSIDTCIKATNDFSDGSISAAEYMTIMQDSSESTGISINDLRDVIQRYVDNANDATTGTDELVTSLDDLKEEASTTIANIELLNNAINSMNEGQTLTGESIVQLLEKYPDLRKELTLTEDGYVLNKEALIELRDQGVDTFNTMIDGEIASAEVAIQSARDRIRANEAEIESIYKLAQAENLLFGIQNKNKVAMGYDGITTGAMTDKALSGIDDQIKKDQASLQGNLELLAKLKNQKQDFNILASGANTKKGSNISSGSSSSSDNPFQKEIDGIKLAKEEIERQIDIIQSKLNLSEVQGDTKAFDEYSNKMTLLLAKKKELAAVEVNKYKALQGKYKSEEEQLTLNELIDGSNKDLYDSEKEYIEQTISLLQRKTDLEKQAYDDKLKQIELEQMLMDENGADYATKEQEKMDLVIALQEKYQAAIKKLKEQGYKDDGQQVREYINLWKDMEMERLSLVKEMAEKRRAIEIENLNIQKEQLSEQYDAKKALLDATIEMLKEEGKANQQAVKDEISGMKKVADEKKRILQEEQANRKFNKEVDSANEEINSIQNDINKLMFDDSDWAVAERAKLEKELKEKREALDDKYYDDKIDKEINAIDEQVSLFEERKNKELEIIEETQLDEIALKKKALDIIDRNNKSLYDKLKKYNSETLKMSQSEFDKMWELANKGLENFGINSKSTLEVLYDMTEAMENMAKQAEILGKAPLDYGTTVGSPNGSTSKPTGEAWYSKKDENAKKMQINSDKWFDASTEEREKLSQSNQQMASEIGAWKGADGEWYIMINGKRMKLYDSIGVRHNGILGGFAGNGLLPNETLIKATTDEIFLNKDQQNMLTKNLIGLQTKKNNTLPPIQLNFNGTITEGAKPLLREFKREIEGMMYKIVNNSL